VLAAADLRISRICFVVANIALLLSVYAPIIA
jgi:hypothetical protein